jgi:hypothetical protein
MTALVWGNTGNHCPLSGAKSVIATLRPTKQSQRSIADRPERRLGLCRRLTLTRPSHPVSHFWPRRNQPRVFFKSRAGLTVRFKSRGRRFLKFSDLQKEGLYNPLHLPIAIDGLGH